MKTKDIKLITWFFVSIILLGVIFLWNSKVWGQEWTTEQKKVWESVQDRWDALKIGDVEAVIALNHDNVFLWSRAYPEPNSNEMLKVIYENWVKIEKPTSAKIRPLKINIFSNIANVYYIYKYEGEKLSDKGRVLETWMKKDNKWLLIGGLSSSCDTLPNFPYDLR